MSRKLMMCCQRYFNNAQTVLGCCDVKIKIMLTKGKGVAEVRRIKCTNF
jgi:hypothetical protein